LIVGFRTHLRVEPKTLHLPGEVQLRLRRQLVQHHGQFLGGRRHPPPIQFPRRLFEHHPVIQLFPAGDVIGRPLLRGQALVVPHCRLVDRPGRRRAGAGDRGQHESAHVGSMNERPVAVHRRLAQCRLLLQGPEDLVGGPLVQRRDAARLGEHLTDHLRRDPPDDQPGVRDRPGPLVLDVLQQP
jgi:hypothetical protein